MIFNLKNVELRCQRTKAPSGRGAEVGDRAGGLREQVLGIIIMKMAIMLMMAIITIPIIILIIALFFLMIIFRHLADELAGMLDRLEIEEERSADVNAVVPGEQEVVEGDDDGRGEEERTRKGHEAEQRVEEGAERQTREEEVSCVGIQQNRPSVIVAARSRKRAIEDETNNKDAAEELSDADVNAVVLGEQEVVGQASLDEARISWIFGYLEDET